MAKTTKTQNQKVVLLDAHAILHRGYHAMPDFAASNGEPTGALYSLVSLVIKVLKDFEPDFIIACYDLPEPTFRHKQFEAYKGTRKEIDQALVEQIKRSKDIVRALGIPLYEKGGYEADDLIGTISKQCAADSIDVVIASGDMDTLQLVDGKHVEVYTLRKGISDTVVYDKKAVIERFGFEPTLLPDFKGLSGDSSDNIPGVAGIGAKSATDLIQAFGTVEEIFENLEKENGEEIFEQKGLKKRVINRLAGKKDEAMFSKDLGTIYLDAPIDFVLPDKPFFENLDREKMLACFDEFEFRTLKVRFEALIEEATGEQVDEQNETKETPEEQLDEKRVQKAKIALWVLNSEKTTPSIDDVYEFAGTKDFEKAFAFLESELKAQNLENIYELEVSIIPIIEKAQKHGVLVDPEYFEKLSKDYHASLERYQEKIYELAETEFNVNSPKQLSEVLFDQMEISTKGLKKTAGGAVSTRESELEKLRGQYEIIDQILGYRELQKLLSTYIDNIPKMLDEKNRLHTSLNQTGTTTGRMSSSSPNLQNIPVRQGLGEAVRNGFVAPKGSTLAAFDYSQIEMRVLAELSGDEALLETFREGRDVHSSVAERVFSVSKDDVTPDQRRQAKVINFGIVYGMGVRALRQNLGGSMDEAQKFYDAYFEAFPKISAYFESVKNQARENGYTETALGRRRYFPDMHSKVPYIKSAAERMAINAPVQGTATGDLVKMAMKNVDETLQKENLENDVFLLLQVHDELIFEISNEKLEKATTLIKHAMENVGTLSVALEVGVKTGVRWGELEERE